MTEKEKKEKKKQEWKEYEEQLKTKTFIDNMLYEEEISDYEYTEDETVIQERIKELKGYIAELEDDEWVDNKLRDNILDCDYFFKIVCHVNIMQILENENNGRISELAGDYDRINNFFRDKDAFTILNLYGVVEKDENGFYKLNDEIVEKIIEENNFYIKDNNKVDTIKDLIFDNWENQKEIITPDKLDQYSEKRNGINFKYFLFCEEFIKTGKITDVAKNLGIGRRTCYDYLQKEEVKKYLQERQQEMKEENTNLMKQRFNECFDTLYDMGVKNKDNSYMADNIKIKAIDVFLKHYENGILKSTTTEE